MPEDLFNFFNIGFINCGGDGTIDFVNDAAFTILDLKERYNNPDELTGKNVKTIFNEYSRMVERAVAEGSCDNLELSFKRKEGSTTFLVHSLKHDEETGSVNMIVRDVSGEKLCEKKLKHSEMRLMSIIDLIPDVIYRLDNNGKIVFISNSISQYGYNPD
jgi:PAS domain-containing protein